MECFYRVNRPGATTKSPLLPHVKTSGKVRTLPQLKTSAWGDRSKRG
jgi:hypothetical protein